MKNILSIYLPKFVPELANRTAQAKQTQNNSLQDSLLPDKQQALLQLARWASRISPLVEVDTNGINLDISGSERLWHGSFQILSWLHSRLTRAKFSSRIALAPTLGAAWALSRFGEEEIILTCPDSFKSRLRPLPLSALRLSAKTESALHEVNLQTIAELLVLPRSSILSRFGAEPLLQLRRALGEEDEPLTPISNPAPPSVSGTFIEPTLTITAIMKSCRELLKKLLRILTSQHHSPVAICIELKRYRALALAKVFELSAPNSSYTFLWSLIYPQLERLSGTLSAEHGVEKITLTATKTATIKAYRQTLISSEPTALTNIINNPATKSTAEITAEQRAAQLQLSELLDRLANRLSAEYITTLSTHASYIPERAFSYRPIQEKEICSAPLLTAERPALILQTPLAVHALALSPDYPPAWVKWGAQSYSVISSRGPERIAPEWWKSTKESTTEESRDYFTVQLESGVWLWLYRTLSSGSWFVQGVWI